MYDWLYSLARVTSFHQCTSADDRQNQEQMHSGPKQEMCDSSEFEQFNTVAAQYS